MKKSFRNLRNLIRLAVMFFVSGLTVFPSLAWPREPLEVYRARRAALMEKIKDGVVVLFGLKESDMAEADLTPFRQENSFFYLTGWNEPGAVLLLLPKGRQNIATALFPSENVTREMLFLPQRDLARERWTGPKVGPTDKNASAVTGVAVVWPLEKLPNEITAALSVSPVIYTLFPFRLGNPRLTREQEKVEQLHALAPFAEIRDIRETIDNLRGVKTKTEMALIQNAVEASVEAHLAAARAIRPGMRESQVGALLKFTWENKGCERAAYAPIVGSGFNSTVLHYNQNTREMKSGEVVVVDAAAECGGYAADITRTFPVNGKFTERQRQIYELVLGAQQAALEAIEPGKTLLRSVTPIVKEYFKKSPLRGPKGEPDTLDNYFIHGIGHWIGLNVHDVGDYSRPIDKNMAFTLEPGIYIPEENLGVRIEDDYWVNDDGKIVKLSARLPSSVQEIERLMAGGEKSASQR